jgi:hypothetical protein
MVWPHQGFIVYATVRTKEGIGSKEELAETMDYPEQEKMHRVLKYLYDELKERGSLPLRYRFRAKKRLITRSVKEEQGIYDRRTGENILEKLGLPLSEFLNTVKRLREAGYISANWGDAQVYGFYFLDITLVTEKGLRLIGELPNPQDQLIQRFETAIYVIENDDRLTETEKKREIDWLEEGKLLARSLTTDAVKALLRGDLSI